MKRNILIVFICFVIGLFLFASAQAQSPATLTNGELRKQNEELKERIKLLEENSLLKAQKDALENGLSLSKPTTTTSPNANIANKSSDANITTVNDTVKKNEAQKSDNENVLPIEGVKNLFLTKSNTVINSVCQQQNLEKSNYNIYDKRICDLARILVQDTKDAGDQKISFRPGNIDNSLRILIAAKLVETTPAKTNPSESVIDKDVRAFILDTENKRNDKQIGGDSKGAGTTSLAVKGGIPQFLSWAVEHGAAVGSRSGNTLTFRVNPVGLADNLSVFQPLKENNFNSLFKDDDKFAQTFRKFSVGFSFDITRGTDPPTFIGSKQQLSAVSVRYNFINERDPRNLRYKNEWEKLKNTHLDPYTKIAGEFYKKLVNTCNPITPTCTSATFKNADLKKWAEETETKLQVVDFQVGKSDIELVENTRQILVEQLDKLPTDKLKTDSEIVSTVNENGKALISYIDAKKAIQDKIAKGTIVTFEYTNYREINAPDVSNFRFIGEKGLGGNWDLTANASISFFNKKPTGMNIKRIRDFDFTLQLEKSLMDLPFGKPIFSFSGQYQRLPGNVAAFDGLVKPNTKGDIAVGQFKLTIPIKDTGIKLPFSLTFANRSELIKERHVGANFGFTFDLDRLLLGKLPF